MESPINSDLFINHTPCPICGKELSIDVLKRDDTASFSMLIWCDKHCHKDGETLKFLAACEPNAPINRNVVETFVGMTCDGIQRMWGGTIDV